jgi:hypothetical protein
VTDNANHPSCFRRLLQTECSGKPTRLSFDKVLYHSAQYCTAMLVETCKLEVLTHTIVAYLKAVQCCDIQQLLCRSAAAVCDGQRQSSFSL